MTLAVNPGCEKEGLGDWEESARVSRLNCNLFWESPVVGEVQDAYEVVANHAAMNHTAFLCD